MPPSTVRTTAPASITASERLRSRTLSSTVDHCRRIAAASGSPATAAAGAATTGSAGGCTGGGDGVGGSAGSGSASGAGAGFFSGGGASAGASALVLRVNCFGGLVACAADGASVPVSAGIDISSRVSMRSIRCSSADSVSLADGSSSRAHTTSSSSRGAVAPRISPRPACTTSAQRVSVPAPRRAA